MTRLIVKNIGPIRFVDIELKKVNVFMGPQSCGKSTLAKIISFCTWMEKTNAFDEKMISKEAYKRLQSYHKLSGSYFNEDSMIYYAGENLTYVYNWKEKEEIPVPYKKYNTSHLIKEEYFFLSHDKKINPKVIYIPAERNFVSVVPNLRNYAEDNDNLLDFIKNWYDAKRKYSVDHKMEVLNMGVEYYLGDGDTDVLQMQNGKKLTLRTASSGLQSIVPMILLIDWLSKGIYEEEKPYSFAEGERIAQLLEELKVGNNQTSDEIDELKRRLTGFIKGKVYTHTQFIIEEPEQNLFPEAQRDLLYYLLIAVNHGRNHRLVITTHSPYILYALNNCLMAYTVKSRMPEDEYKELDCGEAALNPADVAVWEIEDGMMRPDVHSNDNTIQDSTGLIRANYFNRIMQGIMGDFSSMLNYCGEDE